MSVSKPEVKRNPALMPKHKYLCCRVQTGPWEIVAADAGLFFCHEKMGGIKLDNPRESYKILHVDDLTYV